MAQRLMLSMIVLGGAFVPTALRAESCESLSKLAWPTVSITLANTIDSGTFTPPGSTMSFPRLPAFCRVTAGLKPTSDSDIRIEVWLPIADWNGKFIKAFYGREARYSSWTGCSGGGREGLLQAYRYPDEFDGIIAGDPANVRPDLKARSLTVAPGHLCWQ